ncbi:putative exocyst complex component sec8 [Hyphodiscus hymeniophilus]|uniref:Exocyst complex component Sec8 n=1 Tax=Hyphodiscus hymeniophilus TaxID=353542 RepID=A0A9P6VIH8_9HELO|nr:putative exocyst complex component sec8 [Hyphodiscus hymeniophilus]
MPRTRYGGLGDDPYANGNGNGNGYGSSARDPGDYDPYGTTYGDRFETPPISTPSPPAVRSGFPRQRVVAESNAEKQIGVVLEHIKAEWPTMYENECIPVQVALQLLDTSSVGRAHEYRQFEKTHQYLQDSLKAIVHEHHQGFNSSIGTFHKIQASIQASQKRVRTLKDSVVQSKTSLGTTDPELRKLSSQSQNYDDLLHTLSEIEDLRLVPDQLEARISEKRFLTAVEILQNALRRIRVPALDEIGALSDLRSYLTNQEAALTDILIEELHDHMYLKSPYCQERWQILAKGQGGVDQEKLDKVDIVRPFYEVVESLAAAKEARQPMIEDASRNPEADTFYYIELLVESLNKLGRLESAVNSIKQRLPVELFGIVTETNSEVDQKHPSSLRGGLSGFQGNQAFGKENGVRADVIYDLLWTLYAKFEAIAEGHRVFHDVVAAIVEREGARNSSMLLGSFRELWNLYQNEIRSLLHNYVTTDADVYQFNSSPKPGATNQSTRDHLFKFADADSKSVQMTTEYQELEVIIRAAVPGLMSNSRKPGADGKKHLGQKGDHVSRRITNTAAFDSKAMGIGAHKSLIEPSVFNMSLLLPPTLGFLQRLKVIVPPRSDLVTSTLTTFLDNFLVNVFLPQLDETLGKLSDSVFEESDSFQQDPQWTKISRRPIFKGTAAFFALITAFCKMLDTIPHDQALSQLIITQMMRYYDRCCDWFKLLVSRVQDTDGPTLKLSALLATGPGDIHDTMQRLWTSEGVDRDLLEKETGLLILQTNETPLKTDDVITNRETVSSLCVLYTSMKWLAIKIDQLRHITRNDIDSSRATIQRPHNRRWTLLNDSSRVQDEQVAVYLPMTQETVVQFDGIVSSYQNFAGTVLLTLHMEVRCQIINALTTALSPEAAPYLLEQVVNDPDPRILSLNADLVSYDETIVRFLLDKEISFIRTGLGLLIDSFLVTNAGMVKAINAHGCGRMQLNILVLQQNLKNIEADVGLDRAAKFFDLFTEGADAVVKRAKEGKENGSGKEVFSYDELKMLVELCYSEQLASPERGITTSATRSMGDHMLQLEEASWTA